MTTTIGNLAYKVQFDSSQLTRGLMSTRSELSAARKITDSMRPSIDSYTNGMTNLDSMLQKGLISHAHHAVAQKQLQRQMLETEVTTRRLTVAEMDQLKSLRQLDQGVRTTARDEADRAKVMQRGREITEQSRSAQDRLNRSLAEARSLLRAGAIDAATYSKHVAELKKNAAGGGMLSGMGSSFKGTLGAIGAAAGITSLVGVGKDAIQMTANVERAESAMEAFSGSASKAKAIMGDIRKLSSVAGISMLQLSDASASMMGYGVSTEVTMKKLRQFAEISRGDSERMRSLALAFGQVNAAGRLMGQEVLQMINAGFNPLQEIARTTGIEFSTLKKMMENGQVSIDMVSNAFDSATSAGGRFFGVLEKNSEKSSGAISRLSAEWDKFLDTVGRIPPTKNAANFLSDTLANYSTSAAAFGSAEDQANSQTELMDAAKRTGKSGLSRELASEAQKNNKLDERIKSGNFYKQAQEHDARMAAERDRKTKQEADRKANEQKKRDQIASIRSMQQQTMLDQRQQQNPEAFEKFNQITQYLDEPKKKMATEDFARFGNINRILPLLERELQIEFAKLDVLKQQNAARQGRPVEKNPLDQRTPPGPMQPKALQQPGLMQQPGMMQQRPVPTTKAGLTREQHENTSYQSYDNAMAAEMQLRAAEMQMRMVDRLQQSPQQQMMQNPMNVRDQLQQKETQLQQQLNAHNPAASMQKGSQEAYKHYAANQTRGSQAKDPQVAELKKQIDQLKGINNGIQTLNNKLDFELS